MWQIFPPLFLWAPIGIGWYLVYVVLSTVSRRRLRFVFPHFQGVALLGLAWFLSIYLGPLAFIPLLVLAFLAWKNSFLPGSTQSTRWFVIAVRITGLLGVLILIAVTLPEILSPTDRRPVNVILKWEGTCTARGAFRRLMDQEPDSIGDYRTILKDCRLFAVGWAAGRLAEIGDPATDIPLIIDALKRAQEGGPSYAYIAEDIEEALRAATQLSLSTNTPASERERAWLEKQVETAPAE